MSHLNDIKKIAKDNQNDADLGGKIRKYIDLHKTCCDYESNHFTKRVEDAGSYGYYGTEIRCKCGKLIDFKID